MTSGEPPAPHPAGSAPGPAPTTGPAATAAPPPALPERVRTTCARVAARAQHVGIDEDRLAAYADELAATWDPASASSSGSGSRVAGGPMTGPDPGPAPTFADPGAPPEWTAGDPELRTGLVLALAAVNFGSGWHPVLAKVSGLSGARTVAAGITRWWLAAGGLTAGRLAEVDRATVGRAVGQDPCGPAGELLDLFTIGLRDLGRWVDDAHAGRWSAVPAAAGGSAARLAGDLAGLPQWDDRAHHPRAGEVWLYKRAQLAAADLALAGAAAFGDLGRLTLMADNLVPHVLRLDGVLVVDPELVGRIDRSELLVAGSAEEIELRAVAVAAVERLVAALRRGGRPTTAAEVDRRLWWRGRLERYKARPRHRARCTWY